MAPADLEARPDARRRRTRRIVLITFSIRSARFGSAYERNCFYRGLYGWKQIIRHGEARYVYKKPGLLDDIPNIKIDQSLFAIARSHLDEIESYFKEWRQKVLFNAFEIFPSGDLNRQLAKKLIELENKHNLS